MIEVERDLAHPGCHGGEEAVNVPESMTWRGMNQIDFRFVAVPPKTDVMDVSFSRRYSSSDRTPPRFGRTKFPVRPSCLHPFPKQNDVLRSGIENEACALFVKFERDESYPLVGFHGYRFGKRGTRSEVDMAVLVIDLERECLEQIQPNNGVKVRA